MKTGFVTQKLGIGRDTGVWINLTYMEAKYAAVQNKILRRVV